jgi:hypothetical protein
MPILDSVQYGLKPESAKFLASQFKAYPTMQKLRGEGEIDQGNLNAQLQRAGKIRHGQPCHPLFSKLVAFW